jgi:hypothetical protein
VASLREGAARAAVARRRDRRDRATMTSVNWEADERGRGIRGNTPNGASETEGIAQCWFKALNFLPVGKGEGTRQRGGQMPGITSLID